MLKINRDIGKVPVSFTTAFYKRAVRQFNEGYFGEIIALMEQAEIDSHTAGCLMGRTAGFKSGWKLTEAGDSSAEKEIHTFVHNVLSGLNMRELFEDIFDAKLKKFSVLELNWEIVDRKHVVTSGRKINQRYFKLDNDKDEVCIYDGDKERVIPQFSALTVVYGRTPILLSVLRDYILKEYGLQNWLSFIETFGEAFIIGKYPPGVDNSFKEEMENGINALAASARGIFPQGSDIEIIESKRSTSDHEKFIKNCDRGISISLLGHANAVENSNGMQVGQNLSAYQVKREIAIGDIYFIEENINKLVRMLVDRNFTVNQYPVFSIDKSKPIDSTEHLAILKQAYEQGYKIHPDEYAKLGLYKYPDQQPLIISKGE